MVNEMPRSTTHLRDSRTVLTAPGRHPMVGSHSRLSTVDKGTPGESRSRKAAGPPPSATPGSRRTKDPTTAELPNG
jgi:hypothetical protein